MSSDESYGLPKEALDSGAWLTCEVRLSKPGSHFLMLCERFRADIIKPIECLPYEAVFQIKFKNPRLDGLFEEAEATAIEDFENVLVHEIQDSGKGGIFTVHTLNGEREIVFYTKEDIADAAQAMVDKCPSGYKYAFTSRFDPEWTDFFTLLKRVKSYEGLPPVPQD